MTQTLRFLEVSRYDPIHDREVVCLMGVTGMGTWYADVPADGARSLRVRRAEFRNYVLDAMNAGQQPHEVILGD